MEAAHFVLDKKVAIEQVGLLEDLGLSVSYSYKTNHEVGDVLQEECDCVHFSIHADPEIDMIQDKDKISFFTQAESVEELITIIRRGVVSFVVDNKVDFERLLDAVSEVGISIELSLRMQFSEHRIGTGKYYVYGMHAKVVNELIGVASENDLISHLGIHIHRKSQNTSEWEIVEELRDSLSEKTLQSLSFVNLGGGLPSRYKSYTADVLGYVFAKLVAVRDFLADYDIVTIIEPGRFIAAPAITLVTRVIQIHEETAVLNTTMYHCALDSFLTGTRMLVLGEFEGDSKVVNSDGSFINSENNTSDIHTYLLKGNSPTRDDIFRYRVRLPKLSVGDKVVFLNAGAYNYTTDFFGYTKLETVVI